MGFKPRTNRWNDQKGLRPRNKFHGKGSSEVFIGNSFKKFVKNRKDIIVATKVFFNEGALSKEAILREIDGSLKRLQLDYVDLYIIHRWDYNHPIEETMEALNECVKSGKVRYIGCSAMYPILYIERTKEN